MDTRTHGRHKGSYCRYKDSWQTHGLRDTRTHETRGLIDTRTHGRHAGSYCRYKDSWQTHGLRDTRTHDGHN